MAPSSTTLPLAVSLDLTPQSCRVTVAGEVDLATVEHFARSVADLARCPLHQVTLDLTGVTFFGAVGVPVVADLLAAAELENAEVTIVHGPRRGTARVLALCGVGTADHPVARASA